MKKTITKSMFRYEFERMGRKEQFSYGGLGALYDWLEELEAGTGEEQELDVIALCCEFTEYENLEELKGDYNSIETMEDLENETVVIYIDDKSFIIQNFWGDTMNTKNIPCDYVHWLKTECELGLIDRVELVERLINEL